MRHLTGNGMTDLQRGQHPKDQLTGRGRRAQDEPRGGERQVGVAQTGDAFR